MDLLNKAFAQFSDLLRSMTPGGRIAAGLLLVVAVVSVGYVFQHQASGDYDDLFDGKPMQSPYLQKMKAALGKKELNGYTIEGGRVKVPHAQRASYWAALVDAKALPPNSGQAFKEATEGGPFDLPDTSKRKFNLALQEEMSLVIGKMKGIEWASVIIDTQPQGGFAPPLKTASVAVQAIGGAALDDDQVDKIRYYVAAVGMKPENVTIADINGRVDPGHKTDRDPGSDPYNRASRKAEQALDAKVREALAYIPNVTAISTVTLVGEKRSRNAEAKNDPGPAAPTTNNSRTINHESTASSGTAEIQAQGGANQPASLSGDAGKGPSVSSEGSKTEQVQAVSSRSTEPDGFDPTPKLARVSVGIPASYYDKVWQERQETKEGDESTRPDQAAVDKIRDEITRGVRSQVATLLPPAADVNDPTSLVTVTTFPDIKPAPIHNLPPAQRALTWLGENWPMAALVGVVLVSLGMLRPTGNKRRLVGGIPASAAESAAASMRATVPESKPQASEEAVEVPAAGRHRGMSSRGPALRDELSELVKDDPDSAANILRSWIGQGS